MKERPILFSSPMVRAILECRKTQTRRIIKHKQALSALKGPDCQVGYTAFTPPGHISIRGIWYDEKNEPHCGEWFLPCPYGQPGDRLWVRETFYAYGEWFFDLHPKTFKRRWHFRDYTLDKGFNYKYFENPPSTVHKNTYRQIGWYKRPSIHMPRAASRLLLQIESVRIERLKDITEEDAIAEGVEVNPYYDGPRKHQEFKDYWDSDNTAGFVSPISSFMSLWQSVHGAYEAWHENPWVWVITFKRIEPCQ